MLATREQSLLTEKIKQLEPFIGNTPLFPLKNIFQKDGVEIYAKLEWQQLGGSVKARPAFNIIKQAVLSGELHPGKHLLDATSGNTGIAYAAVGAAMGIPVTLCLPENASKERKSILRAYGANLLLTSPVEGTDGAQQKAKELFAAEPEMYFYADQYTNEHNWKAHFHSTGHEIYHQTKGKATHFVAGLGTTGSFMGTGRRLKQYNPDIELVGLHPDTPMHGLEGWKHLETAIVPRFYRPDLADRQLDIDTFKAYEMIKEAARAEGLLLSPSAAANLLGYRGSQPTETGRGGYPFCRQCGKIQRSNGRDFPEYINLWQLGCIR